MTKTAKTQSWSVRWYRYQLENDPPNCLVIGLALVILTLISVIVFLP